MGDPDPSALRRRLERERKARAEAEAIAERVTAELYASVEKLQELNSELEDANQALREFVAVASHDLGNPLTSIRGFTGLLLERASDSGDELAKEMLETMERQGGQMQRLVDDLLILSRLEAGALEPRPAEVVVAEELGRARKQLGDDGRSIEVAAPGDLIVYADPTHLQRTLWNYLTNAVKYGGPPITVDAAAVLGFGEVRVHDQGPGVPAEFAERLFSKFTRADTALTAERKGNGLGLSIVQGLARANGGDAWYEPNEPHGSCFAVKFPLVGAKA